MAVVVVTGAGAGVGGAIVNAGSALACRSVPLQSIYDGAEAAIRGFTDCLRFETIHDKPKVHLTAVDLLAVSTPQSDWALKLNKMGRRAPPAPPIRHSEAPARAFTARMDGSTIAPAPEAGRCPPTRIAPPSLPPRLLRRPQCCARSPNGWISERLR